MIGIDTNILLYAHDRSSPFFDRAKQFIAQACIKGTMCLADISLLEFYSVVTDGRKLAEPLCPSDAAEIVEDILSADEFQVFYMDRLIIGKTLSYARKHNIARYDINDVMIAQMLAHYGVDTIYTVNVRDFKKFDFIQAINPFEPSAPCSMLHAPCPLPRIPYGRQTITEQDVAAVCRVLRSDWLTQGPGVPAFEKAVATYCGATYAVAVNSGTSALHLACLAIGVGPGDVVWTSPITFVASANCARYCGADVGFVDIDPRTYNLSSARLEEKLKSARTTGRLPKVVIPVHLAGQPCDMEAIHKLSLEYGFRIIEDACHAIGGRYKGEPIGNCRFSDITIFSFHPVKTITTGEGGMALTDDSDMAARMALLRTHGITRESAQLKFQGSNVSDASSETHGETHSLQTPPAWYYEQIELGFNYRMTDLQAALGLSQLRRLDEFVLKRHVLARCYDELLSDLPVTRPWQHPGAYSGFHLYVIRLKLNCIRKTHRQIFDAMRSAGIGVNLHYIPVYRHPDFARLASRPRSSSPSCTPSALCPEAERYYAEAISLPMYPTLSEDQQDKVITALKEALQA